MPGALNEIEDLQLQLRSHGGDLERLKRVMSKVMANVYVGKDMSPLFPDIVLQTRVKESSIKRLIGMFTAEYGYLHPETALLCVNQLCKEVIQDSEPTQRGHALQTLSSLNLPNLAEYIAPPIKHALQDLSPYVRRLAVCACVKIYHVNNDVFEEQLFGPHLKEMLEDFDEQVVTSAVTALTEIQPGFKIPKGIAIKILKRLGDFTEWQIPIIFRSINTETLCTNDIEVFDILNILDGYLDDCSAAVVLHVISLLSPLTSTDAMRQQLEKRIKGPLLLRIRHATPEISFWCCRQICHVITDKNILASDYKLFYPSYFDPTYLKAEKVKMLMKITTVDNVSAIIQELLKCLSSPKHSDIALEIVDAVTIPLLKFGEHISSVVVQISNMLEIGSGCTISVLLPCVEKLVHSHKDTAVILLPRLQRCAEFDLSADADTALLSMLGTHGDMLPECTAMLFCYVEQYDQWDANTRRVLLTACIKQFGLKGMPSVIRVLLLKIKNDNDPLLKSRAAFYSSILLKGKDILNSVTANQDSCSIKPLAPFTPDYFNSLPVMHNAQRKGIRTRVAAQDKISDESRTGGRNELMSANESEVCNGALIDVMGVEPNSELSDVDDAMLSIPTDLLGNTTKPSSSDELMDMFSPTISKPNPPKPSNLEVHIEKTRKFMTTFATPTLQPAEYEELWKKPCQLQRFKTLLSNTTLYKDKLQNVGTTLQSYKISTMAASEPNVDPVQLFLYTASGRYIVLAKLQINSREDLLELEVRCDNSMIGSMTCKAIEHILCMF